MPLQQDPAKVALPGLAVAGVQEAYPSRGRLLCPRAGTVTAGSDDGFQNIHNVVAVDHQTPT